MNLIAKNLIPDAGKITWMNGITYAYLDQQLKVKQDISIIDYICNIFFMSNIYIIYHIKISFI